MTSGHYNCLRWLSNLMPVSGVPALHRLTSEEPFHYTSKMIYMYLMIVWKFLRKAWHINAVAERNFY
jgi:hypothetical protein